MEELLIRDCSTLIMQLLRDNLTLWTSDMEDVKGENGPEAAKVEGTAIAAEPAAAE